MARKFVDCRSMPSETNCDVYMSGEEEHVVEAAAQHAITAHGHDDTPELREQMRGALQDETQEVGVAAA
jgi:predicted small metal-binding protein